MWAGYTDPEKTEFHCPTETVERIQVSAPKKSKSDFREFAYRFQKFWDPAAGPTILYIPGGPGEGSINERSLKDKSLAMQLMFGRMGFPKNSPIIFTYPRGVGCNRGFLFQPTEISSRHFADDILAMIKATGLNNYIIYGVSYGTQLATMVASRAASREAPSPRALVLAGTIGNEAVAAFVKQLDAGSASPGSRMGFSEEVIYKRELVALIRDPATETYLTAIKNRLEFAAQSSEPFRLRDQTIQLRSRLLFCFSCSLGTAASLNERSRPMFALSRTL